MKKIAGTGNRYKKISDKMRCAIEAEIRMMLHAHRDCLRNRKQDTTEIRFDCMDGYYGEAFGIMRALVVMGYGFFGANNLPTPGNMKYWFDQLLDQVLTEENFGESNHCDYCLREFGKDGVRSR